MNGAARRQKGAEAEREFLKALGVPERLNRNLEQTRGGGADCVQLPGVALEIKRQEQLRLAQWWEQAQEQATALNAIPVLAYRQNRQPWAIVVPIAWLSGDEMWHETGDTATINIKAFARLLDLSGQIPENCVPNT